MSSSGPSLIRCVHREIDRRAGAWATHIDQCAADDRFRMIERAAGDLLLWIMLANHLGWRGRGLDDITIGPPLSRRLLGENLELYPTCLEHWIAIGKSAADTFNSAAARFDGSPAMTRKIRELATIRDAVQAIIGRRAHSRPSSNQEAA